MPSVPAIKAAQELAYVRLRAGLTIHMKSHLQL